MLSEESGIIDNYTEEQYNNFGWITDNNLVSAQERETLFSRYADYKHNRDKYPTTRFGEAVIHSTECPDVIMYVKGEIGEPNITKVVRINADVMQVKEVLLRYERERYSQPFKLIENYFGEWILDINHKRDYESFREVKARIERERSQASNTDSGTGQDRAGSIQQNSQADRADLKRSAFSLSEQGKSPTEYGNFNIYGEDVKLETEPTEDIAPVMDNIAWGIKKDTSLDGVRDDSLNRKSHDVSSDVSAYSISDIAPVVNKQDISAVETAEEISKIDSDVKLESRPKTRKQLHNKIVDNIKSVFSGKGFDFDEVLKKAKNLSTLSTVDNTPQRVMEKALGYKEGQALADLTVNKVAQNETKGIKWLNAFTDRKNGLLAQLSRRYHIKPGSKESAAAQMYAEGLGWFLFVLVIEFNLMSLLNPRGSER